VEHQLYKHAGLNVQLVTNMQEARRGTLADQIGNGHLPLIRCAYVSFLPLICHIIYGLLLFSQDRAEIS